MFSKTVIVSIATLATSVSALGSAKVVNNCDFDAFVRSIGVRDSPMKVVKPQTVFSESYITGDQDPKAMKLAAAAPPGRTIKVTTSPDVTGAELDFGYAIDGKVWYSLASVNGNPYDGKDVHLSSSDPTCLGADLGGVTRVCKQDADTILTLCASS